MPARSYFAFVLLPLLAGCTLISNSPESAKATVIARVGEETRISGPMTREQLNDLSLLSTLDADRVRALAREGAWIFALLVPDNKPPRYADDGSLVEVIRIGRVLAVRRGKIIGEFEPIP